MSRVAEFQNLLARPNDLVKNKIPRKNIAKKNKEKPSIASYQSPGRGAQGESSN